MKFIITFLLVLISFSVSAQREDVYFHEWDKTWTLQYHHMLTIREKIETLKEEKLNLEEEVKLLEESGATKDIVIKKLQLRDSLYQLEVIQHEKMDSILRDKLILYDKIVDNYNILLISTQEQLNAEAKKARRERLWKNIYKYCYPVAIGVVGFLILKS